MAKTKQKGAQSSRMQGLRDRGSGLMSKSGRRRPEQGPVQRTASSIKQLVAGAAGRLPGGGAKGRTSPPKGRTSAAKGRSSAPKGRSSAGKTAGTSKRTARRSAAAAKKGQRTPARSR